MSGFYSAPRSEDVLFRADLPDWKNNACIRVADALAYAEGYLRGARHLAHHVIDSQRDQDFLVYPVIFLYRHHIELAVKRLIVSASRLLRRALTEDQKQRHSGSHRLDFLWKDLRPMLSTIFGADGRSIDEQDLAGIDDYVNQLSALDPESFSFRYAWSKKG